MGRRLMDTLLYEQQLVDEANNRRWPQMGVQQLVADGEALQVVNVLKERKECTFRVVIEEDAVKVGQSSLCALLSDRLYM